MLILTRKRSEKIQIGENVVIKILQTGRSTVKIGIEAPSNVRVLRSELCEFPLPVGHLGLAERLKLRGTQLPAGTTQPESAGE